MTNEQTTDERERVQRRYLMDPEFHAAVSSIVGATLAAIEERDRRLDAGADRYDRYEARHHAVIDAILKVVR